MLKRHLSLLAFLLILAGIAFGQSTLGNMFRLGTTTTAARPASSATIKGALLYDTDVDAPIINNGSAWSTLGGSNSWADAGGGFIAPAVAPTGGSTAVMVGNTYNDGGYNAPMVVYRLDAGVAMEIRQDSALPMSGVAGDMGASPTLLLKSPSSTPLGIMWTDSSATGMTGAIYGTSNAFPPYVIGMNLVAGNYGSASGKFAFVGHLASTRYKFAEIGGASAGGYLAVNAATGGATFRVFADNSNAIAGSFQTSATVTDPATSLPLVRLDNQNGSGAAIMQWAGSAQTVVGAISGYDSTTGSLGQGLTLSSNSTARSIHFNPGATSTAVAPIARFDGSTRALTFSTGSGSNAITMGTNGARVDFGSGAGDYISGNGTDLTCGAKFSATQLTSTSTGVYNTAVATNPFPAAAGSGHIIASADHDLESASPLFVYDGQNWRQLGMGRSWGAQKKELDAEVLPERTDCPKIRVNIGDNNGADLAISCRTRTQGGTTAADATATSSFLNGRYYRMSVTQGTTPGTDIEKAYIFTGATDTMAIFTQSRLSPNHCAWVMTDITNGTTSVRYWHGLASTDFNTTTGTDTPTAHVAAFRYSTAASDPGWMFVTCNGTTCTATNTGVGIASNTTYLMCIGFDDSGNARGSINRYNTPGAVIVNSATLPGTANYMGVYHYVQTLTDAARSFGISNFSTETN